MFTISKTFIALCALALMASPALAETPRDTLTQVAFVARDKAVALTQVARAETAAAAILARSPGNREALMVQAMATGYRAKLTRSRGTALAARKQFDALAASNPRDPEAHAAVGSWHIGAVSDLGGLMARAGLGAKKADGLAAIDKAVALGGNRALFPALAALLRIELDPSDPRGRTLAETAVRAPAPTALDTIMQKNARTILASLNAGNAKATQKLAKQLMPLGRIPR